MSPFLEFIASAPPRLAHPIHPAFIALISGIVGTVVGLLLYRVLSGHTIALARQEAERIRASASEDADRLAAEARVTAQHDLLGDRESFEQERKHGREELRELERRLAKREDQIDERSVQLDVKQQQQEARAERLDERSEKLEAKTKRLDDLKDRAEKELVRIGEFTREEARAELVRRVDKAAREDAARSARRIVERAERNAKESAREIILNAVQRMAAKHTQEATAKSVQLPSEDMKGRIIGREGRNIRQIERTCGVDLIIDDTPGVIVVSCFDKVRQAIAVEALDRLILDGRIHPAKIEEVVEDVRAHFDERIRKAGEDAAERAHVKDLNHDLLDAMGRLSFRTSYGQNVLEHSVEVAFICQMIADQLGLDGAVARRCGFLHDIGKAMDQEAEGGHPKIGMDYARQRGEAEPVLNAIGGHHGDIPSTSFYTPIVMAADAISGARPGARRESLENYIRKLTDLQDIALSFKGVTEAHAIHAGREVRVMVDAKNITDDRAHLIARRIADKVSKELTFPGEIKVTVLRETRAIEVAR